MIAVPEHINSLPRFAAAKPGQASGAPLVNLTGNENPQDILRAEIERELQSYADFNRYPDSNCFAIREVLAQDVKGIVDNVIVGNGSEGILSYIFKAFCPPHTEVLTANGTFVGVYILAQSFNLNCVRVPLTSGYEFSLDALLEAITEKTRVIYLSNPNNPTGSFLSTQQLEDFLARVPSNILVILDEAYYEYAVCLQPEYQQFDYLKHANLISLRTFSKAYGLANIRFGYGFAQPAIIETLLKVKLTFEPSGIAQHIAFVARQHIALVEQSVRITLNYLPGFYRFFSALNIRSVRSFANFIMIELPSVEIAKEIQGRLGALNIRISWLAPFGLPHCLRITIGSHEENTIFFAAFGTIWAELNKTHQSQPQLETNE